MQWMIKVGVVSVVGGLLAATACGGDEEGDGAGDVDATGGGLAVATGGAAGTGGAATGGSATGGSVATGGSLTGGTAPTATATTTQPPYVGPTPGKPPAACTGESLIDDLEDGDGSIETACGRQGSWYTYNDCKDDPGCDSSDSDLGNQEPVLSEDTARAPLLDAANAPSDLVAWTSGGPFSLWGAGLGVDLNNSGASKGAYDASGHTGIKFWAVAAAPTTVRVNVKDVNTVPEGDVCGQASDGSDACDNDYGKTVALTTTWTEYTISFAELAQEPGWGLQTDQFLAEKLYAIQFKFATGVTFDIEVDGLTFY